MVGRGRKNSPDSSRTSSGSVSRRTSRDRSPSIASSLEDDDYGLPKSNKTPEPNNDFDPDCDECIESTEGLPGDAGRPDFDVELDNPRSKETADLIASLQKNMVRPELDNPTPTSQDFSDIIERCEKKVRRPSRISNKSRSGSIVNIGNKSRSGSIIDPDILDSSKHTTEIKQLETELKQTEIKSRSGSIISLGNKSRSGSIINPDILDSFKQQETELKQTEIKSRSESIISLGNKSRSGSIINPDILDSSKHTTDVKQLEPELKQTEIKSRSGSLISPGNKSRKGSIISPEQVDAFKQLCVPDADSTLDTQDKTPENKSQSDNSSMRYDKSVSRNNSKKYDKSKSNENNSAFINSNHDLSARDQERAKFAFSIYDKDGSGRVDGIFIGDMLRALNLNPTNAVIQSLGGTTRKREKIYTVDEFLPIYAECKKNKKAGSFEDFMEVLKTYDKMEDGNIVLAELEYILLNLGERMEKSTIDSVFADCIPEEDEEGCIEYEHFLRKLCEGFI